VIYENQIWKTQGIDDHTKFQILHVPPKEILLQDGEKTAVKMVASTPNTEGFSFRMVTRQNLSYATSLESTGQSIYPAFMNTGNSAGMSFVKEDEGDDHLIEMDIESFNAAEHSFYYCLHAFVGLEVLVHVSSCTTTQGTGQLIPPDIITQVCSSNEEEGRFLMEANKTNCIMCISSGLPDVEMELTKDSVVVQETLHHLKRSAWHSAAIHVINEMSTKDSGSYICRAATNDGSALESSAVEIVAVPGLLRLSDQEIVDDPPVGR
jgi:hypothetical protein